MSRTQRTVHLAAAIVAAVLCIPVVGGPAFATGTDPGPVIATTALGPVIATDPAAPAAVIVGVDASLLAGLSVTGHAGKTVTLTTPGQSLRAITVPPTKPAVFRNLTPGKAYTVAIGGIRVATATPVAQVTPATGLVVRASTTPGQVDLTWQHTATRATGGTRISYDLTATPLAPTTRTTEVVSGTAASTTASLSGLDPDTRYTITVTPRNSASTGKPTAATMTASLAQITGTTVPTTTPAAPTPASPVPAAVPVTPTPAPAPAPAPAPGPAPAPVPATKTIYVCPAGFPESSAGVCEKTTAYTFHTVTQTSPLTYHGEFVETSRTYRDWGTDWSGTTCPYGGTMHDGHCLGWDIQGYTQQVKDAPPAGWLDNGSTYIKDVPVKDTLPAGYADNGTAWVQTTAKVATVVPA